MTPVQLGLTPTGGGRPLRPRVVGPQPLVIQHWPGELPEIPVDHEEDGGLGSDVAESTDSGADKTDWLLPVKVKAHVNTRSDDPTLQSQGLVRRRCWLLDGLSVRKWFWIVVPENSWLARAEPDFWVLDLEVRLQDDGSVAIVNHVAMGDIGPRPIILAD